MRTGDSSGVMSPRLRALLGRLERGDWAALGHFWHDVEEQGAPLIEPIEDDPLCALVTFLWRATEPVEWVEVAASFDVRAADSRMACLPDTDVWYRTYRLEYDLRGLYKITAKRAWSDRHPETMLDPLNPNVYTMTFADEHGWSDSVVELPGAPPQPWIEEQPGTPSGAVSLQHWASDLLGNRRRLWVYTPPGHARERGHEHGRCPLLILLDGESYVSAGKAPIILDNLIQAGQIPPLVAVMIANVKEDPDARMREFGCSDVFTHALATELLPWVRDQFHATNDPALTVIGGSSMGGLASACAGLRRPDVFGNVLSQSGSFWWRPGGDREHEWLTHQFVTAPKLPLRFYLEVGRLETHQTPGIGPTQVIANRHLRDVLQARDYSITYGENNGGHNFLSWRGTLSDGLIALLGHLQPLPSEREDENVGA